MRSVAAVGRREAEDFLRYGDVYVAVTVTGPVMVITHSAVPVQAPLQPMNIVAGSLASTT